MTTIQITCDNCGAKYKLPESFTSPKAKCQKCGSVIDVSAQREAAAAADEGAGGDEATAAGKPAAAAKPAVDRSKGKPAATRAPARAGRRAAGRRGRGDDEGEEEAGAAHHGRHRRAPKKKDNTATILGLVGLVAIVIVAIVFFMQEDEKPKENATAQGDPKASQPAEQPAEKPTDQPPAEQPEDQPEQPAKQPGEKPESGGEAEEDPELPPGSPKWMLYRKKIKTMADVDFEFPEVPWDRMPASKKEELQNLAADYAAGGGAGRDAEQWMRDHPYEAMFGLLDLLRSLDYKDSFQMMTTAYPLNRFMTELTYGLQTGFTPPGDMNAEMDPAQIHWNCITTRAWLQFFDIHPDEATFKEKNEERRKKQLSEGK